MRGRDTSLGTMVANHVSRGRGTEFGVLDDHDIYARQRRSSDALPAVDFNGDRVHSGGSNRVGDCLETDGHPISEGRARCGAGESLHDHPGRAICMGVDVRPGLIEHKRRDRAGDGFSSEDAGSRHIAGRMACALRRPPFVDGTSRSDRTPHSLLPHLASN